MESWNVSQGVLLLQVAATSWCASASGCSAGWRSDAWIAGIAEIWRWIEAQEEERKRQDACAETRPPSASVLSSIVVVRGLFGEVIFFLNLSYWTCIYIFYLQWSVCCNKFTLPSTNNICFFSSLLHLTDSTATFPKGVLSLQTEFNWKLRLESAQ